MSVPYIFATTPGGQAIPLSHLDDDFASINNKAQIKMEELTITVTNTFPLLSESYSGNIFLLIINGSTFVPVGALPPFSVSTNTITWLSTIWSVNPGDSVVAVYSYTG